MFIIGNSLIITFSPIVFLFVICLRKFSENSIIKNKGLDKKTKGNDKEIKDNNSNGFIDELKFIEYIFLILSSINLFILIINGLLKLLNYVVSEIDLILLFVFVFVSLKVDFITSIISILKPLKETRFVKQIIHDLICPYSLFSEYFDIQKRKNIEIIKYLDFWNYYNHIASNKYNKKIASNFINYFASQSVDNLFGYFGNIVNEINNESESEESEPEELEIKSKNKPTINKEIKTIDNFGFTDDDISSFANETILLE